MSKLINYDSRWCGDTGIGRFAYEIRNSELKLCEIKISGNPADKYDVFKLTSMMLFNRGLFFSPGYNSPFFFLKRCIITIHDLNHVDLDFNSSYLKKLYYKIVLKRACRNCSKILTVSEFSKKRIVEWSGISPKKVIVVGNGVSKEFNQQGPKYSPGYPYILVVGNRKEHKNEFRALQAFFAAKLNSEIRIIFTGFESEALIELTRRNNAENKVIFAGRLTNNELADMYRGANCLLFPSLYEGFGIPVIEAMACGTPVITSNTTSLAEIAGSAACLVNPEDTGSIIDGLMKVHNDHNYRATLIVNGYEQAKKYTWEDTIKKVKGALEDI